MKNNQASLSIKEWAEEDRPREKLITKGKSALSDAELIAILLGSGTRTLSAVELAKQILLENQYDLNRLARLSVKDLIKFKGIGEAKAISIVSALELGRRRKGLQPDKKPRISGSSDAYEFMSADLTNLNHEEFWVILLKRNHEVLAKERISIGGVSGTLVDPKVIFKKALEWYASSLVLIHNHPSGNLTPSAADTDLTKKIKGAGQLLEINVIDHLIFTDHGYYSFSDQGLM